LYFLDDAIQLRTLTQHKKTSGSRLDNPERASEQQKGETELDCQHSVNDCDPVGS